MTIEQICRKYDITNYTINPDGSIDVNGDVSLSVKSFNKFKLPLKFNNVNGNFYCDRCNLTTLEGCPKYVKRTFDCSNNSLTSLEGGPTEVRNFKCDSNYLTNLNGSPIKVGRNFQCFKNKLTSLVGCPKEVGHDFYCGYNNIYDLTEFDCKFRNKFYCDNNPIGSIFNEGDSEFIYAFKVFQVIKGNEVNLRRLKYVMSTWGKEINLFNIEKRYVIV